MNALTSLQPFLFSIIDAPRETCSKLSPTFRSGFEKRNGRLTVPSTGADDEFWVANTATTRTDYHPYLSQNGYFLSEKLQAYNPSNSRTPSQSDMKTHKVSEVTNWTILACSMLIIFRVLD